MFEFCWCRKGQNGANATPESAPDAFNTKKREARKKTAAAAFLFSVYEAMEECGAAGVRRATRIVVGQRSFPRSLA